MYSGRDPYRPQLSERDHRQIHDNYRDKAQFNRTHNPGVMTRWRSWIIVGVVVGLIVIGLVVGLIVSPPTDF
ncbi:MAG: hypothetical protein QF898_20315 [SAR202 cluster bacterium]|jgi:hypothetical protein|nr:hypothetical protein [SAR202 cluster bacterium]